MLFWLGGEKKQRNSNLLLQVTLALITVLFTNNQPSFFNPHNDQSPAYCVCVEIKQITKRNCTNCAVIILNTETNWTCDGIGMIAQLCFQGEHSKERQLWAHSLVLWAEVGGGGEGKICQSVKTAEAKSARNICSSTHNSLISTQEKPRMSAVLFASAPDGACDGRAHYPTCSTATLRVFSITQNLVRSHK